MEVLFIVLPLAILMAGGALGAFFWSVHWGQFDDLDTPAYRIILDEDHSCKISSPTDSSSPDRNVSEFQRD